MVTNPTILKTKTVVVPFSYNFVSTVVSVEVIDLRTNALFYEGKISFAELFKKPIKLDSQNLCNISLRELPECQKMWFDVHLRS